MPGPILVEGSGPPQPTTVGVLINGLRPIVLGDPVSPHGGPPPHVGATMLSENPKILVNGKPICTSISRATCGDSWNSVVTNIIII